MDKRDRIRPVLCRHDATMFLVITMSRPSSDITSSSPTWISLATAALAGCGAIQNVSPSNKSLDAMLIVARAICNAHSSWVSDSAPNRDPP